MDHRRRLSGELLGRLLLEAVEAGDVPAAVVVAGIGPGAPSYWEAFGWAERWGGVQRLADPATVFDLASLTKVIATLPCLLRLVEARQLALDDPVVGFVPDFAGPGKDGVTIRHLLTHTSGLPDHRPYWERASTPAQVLAAALAEPLVYPPGVHFCYSDIGYIVAGRVVEVVAGLGLDGAFRELVGGPLGLEATGFCPSWPERERIAATEAVGGQPPKVGVVHDENAEALGGVAGHAGLFGPASDVAVYVRAWLDPGGDFLSHETRAEALRCQTDGLGGRRGLGWSLRGDRWDHTDGGWPATGAGHTGFTGTSIALDPVSGLWMVLLTNAVHYGRDKSRIVALRRRVHAALASEAGLLADGSGLEPADETVPARRIP
jgi:CubicO group peptidase (beta-lactamase class C family)